MIRNTLYSLFLHFLLILLVYASFSLKTITITENNEISISLLEIEKKKEPIEVIEDKKEPPQKKEVIKKPPKKKPKRAPKKKIIAKIKKVEPKKTKKEVKPKKVEPTPVKEDPKIKPEKQEEVPEKEQLVNNLNSLNLSVRERFNFQSQLGMCYKRAVIESGGNVNKVKITIVAEIALDGFIDSDLEEIIDMPRYKKDVNYKNAIDNTRRTIELCSPLRNLPLDKYEIWKKVSLEFGKGEN